MFTKKRFGLILGLVALALTAVPAVAGAHTVTNAAGNHVAKGTTIVGTSLNATTTTLVGALTCEEVVIYGIVDDSGAAPSKTVDITMHPSALDEAFGCHRTTPTETEEVIVTPTFETVHLDTNAGGTNTATFSYQVHFPKLGPPPGGLTCNFGGTVAASVTAGGGLQATGAIGGTSPEPCPKGGNFSGTFTITDGEGSPITID